MRDKIQPLVVEPAVIQALLHTLTQPTEYGYHPPYVDMFREIDWTHAGRRARKTTTAGPVLKLVRSA